MPRDFSEEPTLDLMDELENLRLESLLLLLGSPRQTPEDKAIRAARAIELIEAELKRRGPQTEETP
jgi:hypothetical protein